MNTKKLANSRHQEIDKSATYLARIGDTALAGVSFARLLYHYPEIANGYGQRRKAHLILPH